MARRRQNSKFQRLIERLVAENNAKEAFDLLTQQGWVPSGSGFQKHLPNGLNVYVRVDELKAIVVSTTGRYWAWCWVTIPEIEFEDGIDLVMLAHEIWVLESHLWRIQHDNVISSDEIAAIKKHLDQMIRVFALSLDLESEDEIRDMLHDLLSMYEAHVDAIWQKVIMRGATFWFTKLGEARVFQTYARFKSTFTHGRDFLIVRELGTNDFGIVHQRECEDARYLELCQVDDPHLVAMSQTDGVNRSEFNIVTHTSYVFEYTGNDRSGVWETFCCGYDPATGALCAIAIKQDRTQIGVFTASDLGNIIRRQDDPVLVTVATSPSGLRIHTIPRLSLEV